MQNSDFFAAYMYSQASLANLHALKGRSIKVKQALFHIPV